MRLVHAVSFVFQVKNVNRLLMLSWNCVGLDYEGFQVSVVPSTAYIGSQRNFLIGSSLHRMFFNDRSFLARQICEFLIFAFLKFVDENKVFGDCLSERAKVA